MHLREMNIPDKKIKQFESKGISSVEQLLRYFPRKYLDFRRPSQIKYVKDGEDVAIVGRVTGISVSPKCLKVTFVDRWGSFMDAIWFNGINYLKNSFIKGSEYVFCGKVTEDPKYRSRSMKSPVFSMNKEKFLRIYPVYSKIKSMSEEYLLTSMENSLEIAKDVAKEYLEEMLIKKYRLPLLHETLKSIHFPEDEKDVEIAKRRIVFDDLFQFNMQLYDRESLDTSETKFVMKKCVSKEFIDSLPFELTDGQKETLRSIYKNMHAGKRVNALVQGDVGCGKTIVAIILMMVCFENGYQSALMCPTNVLAKQHYDELLEKTKNTGCKVVFLSGNMKAKERRQAYKAIKEGEAHIIVGTHAVISKDVEFKNLALTVVDEEHRFGVEQRKSLKEKAKEGVHSVAMSATPIPRTLAMTIHGDSIEVYTIKTLPNGRKPVKTILYSDEIKTYVSIYNQVKEGRQAYVVCPLIEDSEAMEGIDSVETTYQKMTSYFSRYPNVKIGMLTGDMKEEEVTAEINRFARNELQILISTTIIEVGVNVPNTTVIMIKNAERFGLSQLHQLRGRVGRGSFQSYCVLLSDKTDNEKLIAMCETTDGFKISEVDLKLRGAGDFLGTKQSGLNKYVELMLSHQQLNKKIREEVKQIYEDPERFERYRFLVEENIAGR